MARGRKRVKIDVEALLTLAYRDHVVDRVTVAGILAMRVPSASSTSSTAGIMAHLARGVAVDTSSAGAVFLGRASQMQAVADDMIDVHDAVLALPRFYADLGAGLDFVVWDDVTLRDAPRHGFDVWQSGGGYRIAPRRNAVPTRPPRGYRKGVPLVAPEAAEGDACALYPRERAPDAPSRPLYAIEPAPLLIECARAGLRPDLSPPVVERWRPVYRGRDKRAVGYEPVWLTKPAVRALERATYAAWRAALEMLVDELDGLEGYRVLPAEAPAEPWQGEAEECPVPCPGVRLDSTLTCSQEKAW